MSTWTHERYLDRVEALTGERWCPYPSDRFMEEILNSNDERATKLIEARRKYTFPAFLAGDPQEHEYSA
jgi:hypothetical protein